MKSKTILQHLQEHHIAIQAMCNGKHQCGQCKVKIFNRELDWSDEEKALLNEEDIKNQIHLACFHTFQQHDHILVCQQDMDILEDMSEDDKQNFCFCFGIGLIVDIGTTTVVMKWIDRQNGKCLDTVAFVNPQVSFGGDVISRIHYQNTHQTTLLHDLLIESLENHIIQKNRKINQMIFCGNTTMIYFLLGEDVKPLGEAPFTVLKKDMQRISSRSLFKNVDVDCPVITFPHISAYVGGDITAGILATRLDMQKEKTLFMDLGTNGEMVIGNQEELIATSSAAGPAFEGVGISCGGSSIPGAICDLRLRPLTLKTIHNQSPQCLCGSGLIALMSECVKYRLIDPLGKLIDRNELSITGHLTLYQKDIQNFQLAKAAIQTGVTILLKDCQVQKMMIAGGFGSHLDINDLKILKVIPQDIQNIQYCQNSALKGCYLLLMTQDFHRVHEIARKVKTINLATHSDFEDVYLESLYFYDEDHCL